MSKPIICKKCGTVYTSAQTVCPNCMTHRPRNTEKIIACAAIFFIVIGIVSVLAGTFGDDSESVDSLSSAQSSVPTDGASRITTDEETIRLNIGETLNANGLQITLDEVSDWNSDNMFVSPKDGYKFIRAYFIMKNTNKTDRYLGSFDFTCYADDSKMEKAITAKIPLISEMFQAGGTYRAIFTLRFRKTRRRLRSNTKQTGGLIKKPISK